MMLCPFCLHHSTFVSDSRPSENGNAIRRRRKCENCEEKFTTYEHVHLPELAVIKRNGRRELFDRQKMERSLRTALRKRDISDEHIGAMVSAITHEIDTAGEHEVSSEWLGKMAMRKLATVDMVGLVRYASVYQSFESVDDFQQYVQQITRNAPGKPLSEK